MRHNRSYLIYRDKLRLSRAGRGVQMSHAGGRVPLGYRGAETIGAAAQKR